jgi:alpha-L-fucosidase 2
VKNTIIMNYPASWWRGRWRDALPAGNGRIGASVYGGVHEETVLLNHGELWWNGQTPPLPDVSSRLDETRRLLLAGEPCRADRVLADALAEEGYEPRMSAPLPLGDLKLFMPQSAAFKDYSRRLHMDTGEISVGWTDGQTRYMRRLFVSRTADTLVYELNREGPAPVTAQVRIQLHGRQDCRKPVAAWPAAEELRITDNRLFYAAQRPEGGDFGAVAKVVCHSGSIRAAAGGLAIEEADSVLILVKLFACGGREAMWGKLADELDRLPESYEELLAPHKAEHGRLFHAMQFDLGAEGRELSTEELLMQAYRGQSPDALMEKMWAFGRYLLVSATRAEGQPCHLYGLWCGEYDGLWAFHMVNENLQMMYWQALSGNMPELLLAVFSYMEELLEDFRTNARQLFGCRGIYIPAPTAPGSGLLKHKHPHIIHWTGGAGWISQHYYDYYMHTGDMEFLRNCALPFMREAALFYEDFFTLGEDGYWISSPSNSPENTPGNYWQGPNHSMETTVNATMDFAIARELFTNLAEGAAAAGCYQEEIPRWQAFLERIPPYQLNEDGAVREWMHPGFRDNYHHRHQSHLYPVFPGTEVTRSGQPELFGGFVKAVEKRLVLGLKEQSGWSLAHMANNYARMGQGDEALECLDILSRSCVLPNLFTLHNDWRGMGIGVDMEWAPVQLDANMGWSSAVHEMLLFSKPGELHILPALPSRWRRGTAGPLLARGGVECSICWDTEAGWVELELRCRQGGQQVELHLPAAAAEVPGYTQGQDGVISGVAVGEAPLRLEIRLHRKTPSPAGRFEHG